ncbi:MAG: CDP-alcohol phosphatidyltransferase family protein [Deltaproteobacteria bacterium]|nr:CDP-alcohol phosphatidyltransferase family protein [Deltaproteobacteria bacterium]
MFSEAKAIYLATRKRHDQLFNTYFMRPIAGFAVAVLGRTPVTPNQLTLVSVILMAVAAAIFIAWPDPRADWVGVIVLEASYLFDCCDGMLARHKKLASKQGHLFDFFTDETKAVMLVGALAIRQWRTGGYGLLGEPWPAGSAWFLVAGIVAVAILASASSLTNFVRRPEISGRETPVEAHYETLAQGDESPSLSPSLVRRLAGLVVTFLRFLNHYPSHIWLFGLVGRLDVFFWVYAAINLLYLGRGWLGLVLRFGRSGG